MADSVDSQVMALLGPTDTSRTGAKFSENSGNGVKNADSGAFSQVLDGQRSAPLARTDRSTNDRSTESGGNALPPARRDSAAETRSSTADGVAASSSSQDDVANDSAGGPEASANESEAAAGPEDVVSRAATEAIGPLASAGDIPSALVAGGGAPTESDAPVQPMQEAGAARTLALAPGGSDGERGGRLLTAIPTAGPGSALAVEPGDALRSSGTSGDSEDLASVPAERSITQGTQSAAGRGNSPASLDRGILLAQTDAAAASPTRTAGGAPPPVSTPVPGGNGVAVNTADSTSELPLTTQAPAGGRATADGGIFESSGRDSSGRDSSGRDTTAAQSVATASAAAQSRSTTFANAMNAGLDAAAGQLSREAQLSDGADVAVATTRGVESSMSASGSSGVSAAPTAAAAQGLSAVNSSSATYLAGAGGSELALERSPNDPEFADEFTSRVRVLLRDGVREARLQLHPAELGRLHVTISTDGDQARISFVADTAGAKEAIEQHMPRLREMLEQNGLQLAQSDVADRSLGSDRERDEQVAGAPTGDAEADEPSVDLSSLQARTQDGSRIDTYI